MSIDPQTLKEIIEKDNAKRLVEEADKLGQQLARNLSTSQIRVVYKTVKLVSESWTSQSSAEEAKAAFRQILLLKPKLAYQEARAGNQQKPAMRTMREVIESSIDLINEDLTKFKRFAEFFEAILAYHKAYGGK
jgi:CRISPR-associated protein Csm2